MRCRVTRRLTWIQAVWHSDNLFTNFEIEIEELWNLKMSDYILRGLRVKPIKLCHAIFIFCPVWGGSTVKKVIFWRFFYIARGCVWKCLTKWTLLLQYWSLLNWHNLRLLCGCVAVTVNWFFGIISPCFAKFKNIVHRVTRRLTRLQTMCNVLRYSKIL